MTRILIIDDDPGLVELLTEYLQARGHEVISASNGDDGLLLLTNNNPDLIILDVMMPGKDGFQVCREIRSKSQIPVIMLTARGDEYDRIIGLEIGADDYLPKPFNPRELLARISAVLRRGSNAVETESSEIISVRGISINAARREAKKDGLILDLTTTEFEILRVLLVSAGRVVPRERLMELARGPDWASFERSVDVHISHLRRKIGDPPKKPIYIKTIRGVGYMLPSGE